MTLHGRLRRTFPHWSEGDIEDLIDISQGMLIRYNGDIEKARANLDAAEVIFTQAVDIALRITQELRK